MAQRTGSPTYQARRSGWRCARFHAIGLEVDTLSSRAWGASREWGTTAAERELVFPCDALAREADTALFRGVSVNASAAAVFRWLCQLRIAPYSYDWIDNGGRRSPPHLVAGLAQLSRGQEFMRIFTLVDFESDRHISGSSDRARPKRRLAMSAEPTSLRRQAMVAGCW